MTILQHGMVGSAGGYQIPNSLRFRSSASAYLSRTPASAGNRTTWTWSGWVKRGTLTTGTRQGVFNAYLDGNNYLRIMFDTTDQLVFNDVQAGADVFNLITTQVFRDPSAWYHLVFVCDTTNAASSNRVKLYVNGTQTTALSLATYPSQNANGMVNSVNPHYEGRVYNPASSSFVYFDGYLSEINFIDGQALTPSSFGETNTDGVWVPKAYTGTYGTNGFYLNFNNATSTTTLGYDSSGNSNNWTCNNISLTSGVTYDHMTDTPTNNYAVLNPLTADSNATFSGGNLTIASNTTGEGFIPATIAFDITSSTGYYFEVTVDSNPAYCTTGFIPISKFPGKMWTGGTYPGLSAYNPGFEVRFSDGTLLQNGGSSAYGSGATAGDTWGFAIKNGKVWARNSSGWFNSGNPVTEANPAVTGQTGQWLLGYAERAGAYGAGVSFNFGQRPFAYTPPTGFKALCTANLLQVAIPSPKKHFDAALWTGNQAARTITNLGEFQPGLVWTKSRSDAESHRLHDSVRGGNGTVLYELNSNLTEAEGTDTLVSGVASNGFTIAAGVNTPNVTGRTYVGWLWKANGSGVTNTDGSITSTVSANQTAGFSIVTYTGTGANATVGHGLGDVPAFIVIKDRTAVRTSDQWPTLHKSTGATGGLVYLNSTGAGIAASVVWNNTNPTSSVFSVGAWGGINYSGDNYVAYCFSEIAGYSKFGSYTGNGSTDGPFVYCGFRPKYVLVKRADSANWWWIWDSARNTYNPKNDYLTAESSAYENNNGATIVEHIDAIANGFKVRNATLDSNTSGATYIFAAFAESPFGGSNVSPSPAR